MQIRPYLDEDAMDSDLVRALRLRGVDVTTALDAGLTNSADEERSSSPNGPRYAFRKLPQASGTR